MARNKIHWEWGEHPDEIYVIKDKGKLTMEEIWRFLQTKEALDAFGENALAVILFRMREREDFGLFEPTQSEGDAQSVYILADGSKCICGRTELWMQYCPDCGRKLIDTQEGR